MLLQEGGHESSAGVGRRHREDRRMKRLPTEDWGGPTRLPVGSDLQRACRPASQFLLSSSPWWATQFFCSVHQGFRRVQLAPSFQWCSESSCPVVISQAQGTQPHSSLHVPKLLCGLHNPLFSSSPSLSPGVTLPVRVNKLTLVSRRQDRCSHNACREAAAIGVPQRELTCI